MQTIHELVKNGVRAPDTGYLRVGLNGRDPSNNEGWISFEGSARAPTPQEWLATAPKGE